MGTSQQTQLFIEIGDNKVRLPFLILTQNLIIRPLLNQDYNIVLNSIRQSLRDIKIWLPWVDGTPDESEYISITRNLFEEANSGKHCHFCVYHNELFLGVCSYMDIKSYDKIAKIGFWCGSNNGYEDRFVDAVNAIIRYGFDYCKVEKFHIPCVVGNYLSELMAKQLSFKLNTLEFMGDKQIKNFIIDSNAKLPPLEMQIVEEK